MEYSPFTLLLLVLVIMFVFYYRQDIMYSMYDLKARLCNM